MRFTNALALVLLPAIGLMAGCSKPEATSTGPGMIGPGMNKGKMTSKIDPSKMPPPPPAPPQQQG